MGTKDRRENEGKYQEESVKLFMKLDWAEDDDEFQGVMLEQRSRVGVVVRKRRALKMRGSAGATVFGELKQNGQRC